jgi:hypothetical protein
MMVVKLKNAKWYLWYVLESLFWDTTCKYVLNIMAGHGRNETKKGERDIYMLCKYSKKEKEKR